MPDFDTILKEVKRLWLPLVLLAASLVFLSTAVFFTALGRLSMMLVVLAVINLVRKSYWPDIDIQQYAKKALEHPFSAAAVFASIIFFIVSLCFITLSHAMTSDSILTKASVYLPVLKTEKNRYWPGAPHPEYLAGKIEQETCASNLKCWNPNVSLKTSREYGFGLSQMTIAYKPNGSVRFNKFEEARSQYAALADWSWDNRYEARYHLTFIVLDSRRLYDLMARYFSDNVSALAASMVAYNAGERTVLDRRSLCMHTNGCDATVWFGGLATVRSPGEERLLYGKPLYQRRNEYPHNIIHVRSGKYLALWGAA